MAAYRTESGEVVILEICRDGEKQGKKCMSGYFVQQLMEIQLTWAPQIILFRNAANSV